jgi:hypothetical protein
LIDTYIKEGSFCVDGAATQQASGKPPVAKVSSWPGAHIRHLKLIGRNSPAANGQRRPT